MRCTYQRFHSTQLSHEYPLPATWDHKGSVCSHVQTRSPSPTLLNIRRDMSNGIDFLGYLLVKLVSMTLRIFPLVRLPS